MRPEAHPETCLGPCERLAPQGFCRAGRPLCTDPKRVRGPTGQESRAHHIQVVADIGRQLFRKIEVIALFGLDLRCLQLDPETPIPLDEFMTNAQERHGSQPPALPREKGGPVATEPKVRFSRLQQAGKRRLSVGRLMHGLL